MTLDPACTIARTETHVETELDDEIIAMSVQTGLVFSFTNTAREIWAFLGEERRFEQIVAHMMAEFDVARDACEADIARFIETLADHGMVRVSDA